MPMRNDIVDATFPRDAAWFTAEVEPDDVDRMFMIRVPDFNTMSKGSWQIRPAAEYFAETFSTGMYDPQYPYNADKMRKLLAWSDRQASRAILVSDTGQGPTTILDGNHRLVLLQHENALVGASVYIGLHAAMRGYNRAMPSFAAFATARP